MPRGEKSARLHLFLGVAQRDRYYPLFVESDNQTKQPSQEDKHAHEHPDIVFPLGLDGNVILFPKIIAIAILDLMHNLVLLRICKLFQI
jgi:hypothetical protein